MAKCLVLLLSATLDALNQLDALVMLLSEDLSQILKLELYTVPFLHNVEALALLLLVKFNARMVSFTYCLDPT